MAYEQDRIDNTIRRAKALAATMNQFAANSEDLKDLWNAEEFGSGATNEITQELIDSGTYAGLPLSRLQGFMTQVFSFCDSFYTSSVKGEIDKFREVS